MSILQRIDRHARLFSRMADANGADLDLALQAGAVSPGEIREAVLSCTGCTDPGACESLLDAGTEGVPSFCRNAGLIRQLGDLIDG